MKSLLDKRLDNSHLLRREQAELLLAEMEIANYGQLLVFLPYRYEDRSIFHNLSQLNSAQTTLHVQGTLGQMRLIRGAMKSRLVASFSDGRKTIDLIWFNQIHWIQKKMLPGHRYVLYGKISTFQDQRVVIHPELTPLATYQDKQISILPLYHTTKKLLKVQVNTVLLARLQKNILQEVAGHIPENLPSFFVQQHQLLSREVTLRALHFPADQRELARAQYRFKLEELFFLQLRLARLNRANDSREKSFIFSNHSLLLHFQKDYLPFQLTLDQEKALQAIIADLGTDRQMNRLLQGDVGSGKTIVAFLSSLLPIADQAQVAVLVPTEILALQHATTLQKYAAPFALKIALLTGSTTTKTRKEILRKLADGSIDMIVGTHALLQEGVTFARLGLLIIDEQHRFGVAQRAKLWHQSYQQLRPHVLVMTATPIPRTLAMTLYSGLAITTIATLPPGRLPAKTYHCYDSHRLRLFGFLKKKIAEGRQACMVYPLIEESAKADYKYLIDGYESIKRAFPTIQVGILHSRMKPSDKTWEMNRFFRGETQIMVATTVIEVGVNVPNATIMVVENAERFGLAQLHQLRGRIKRSSHQPYCFLMTAEKISQIAAKRIQAMVQTDDGFSIAEVDLKLRGPGNLVGLQQSGILKLRLANLAEDEHLVKKARKAIRYLLNDDPYLEKSDHQPMLNYLKWLAANTPEWEKVS